MKLTDKKILVVSVAGEQGGKANFTRLLLNIFNEYNVTYYHINNERANSKNKFFRIAEHLFSFIYYKLVFIQKLIFHKIDIVQLHTSTNFDFFDYTFYIMLSKMFGKTTIVRYGGSNYANYYGSKPGFFKKYILWNIHLTDKWIVQSPYWQEFFKDIVKSEDEIFVLPNFVDLERFTIKEEKYSKGTEVLYIPGFDLKGKGFYEAINPLKELATVYPQVKFHIVGKNIKEKSTDNLIIYDSVYGNEKTKLFDRCQVFLLATHAEGFPNALLEAMAAGMGIVSSDIPQISCLVDKEKDVLFFEVRSSESLKEKLEYLLNHPERVKELGVHARKSVEDHYDLKFLTDYLVELYKI